MELTGLPRLAEAFAALPTDSAVLDGELCLCDSRGRPDFRALHTEMRQGRPDVSRMAFFAFDLLFEKGCRSQGPAAHGAPARSGPALRQGPKAGALLVLGRILPRGRATP